MLVSVAAYYCMLQSGAASPLQHPATCCNTPCSPTPRCNPLRPTATHLDSRHPAATRCSIPQHAAAYCNTLQHVLSLKPHRVPAATHCNTLQHSPSCNTLQHAATQCNIHCDTPCHPTLHRAPAATHCNTLQYTATYCNTHCNTPCHPTLHRAPTAQIGPLHPEYVCVCVSECVCVYVRVSVCACYVCVRTPKQVLYILSVCV